MRGFFVLVLAHRQRWTRAPAARRSANSSPPKISANASYAIFAFAIAARPRAASASSVPISSRYLSDLRVDAADEEARDAGHADALAPLVAAAKAGDVRARHALVDVDAEHQRDVDVDALGDRVLDGRDPGLGRRDLDEHVRPIEPAHRARARAQRGLGILGEVRLDLDAREAIGSVGGVVTRHEARPRRRRRRRRRSPRRSSRASSPALDLAADELVVLAGRDGLGEDRRVAGEPANAVVRPSARACRSRSGRDR